jgi:hypothetical protein
MIGTAVSHDRATDLLVDSDAEVQTSNVTVMGRFGYMAPKRQLRGKTANHRADIFALGCAADPGRCPDVVRRPIDPARAEDRGSAVPQ